MKEFPTAPRDSFLVANAAYLDAQIGQVRAEIVLVKSGGDPRGVAGRIRSALGPSSPLKVSDISQAAHLIGSSLTAVDVATLGSVELGFAVLFVAMAAGLTLWLGQSERGRTNAVLLALGAPADNIRSFLWAETAIVSGFGLPIGAFVGATTSWMLVRLLSGVFDPPPDALTIPWRDLGFMLALALCAIVTAVVAQSRWTKDWAVAELRA